VPALPSPEAAAEVTERLARFSGTNTRAASTITARYTIACNSDHRSRMIR
jgi:hypothetical protein